MAITAKPKRPAHYKKRQAGHHRQGKHYLKAYFPYLPLLMAIGLGLYINNLWSYSAVLGSSLNLSAEQLLLDTNGQRLDHQLAPLELDPALTAAAQAKAEDMVAHNYWAHTSPNGKSPWNFISASGYQYQAAGENLAYGFKNADEVITGWMNSPEHRENMLSHDYLAVGFAVASAENFVGHGPQTVVVAEYADPAPVAANISFRVPDSTVPQPATPEIKGAHTELPSQRVARVQLLTGGQAAWSYATVALIGLAALLFLLFHHGYRFQRMMSRGEAFIAHHPWWDFVFVLLMTAGYVLTRTGGLIR